MLYEIQLRWIAHLHEFRNEFLDTLFRGINYCDRIEFFVVLIPLVWIFYGRKIGLRVLAIFLLSKVTNVALKEVFQSPRPFHLIPELMVLRVGGLGFPSGAAQTVILLSGILLHLWKTRWKWLVVGIYVPLVSFSRIYLGVHFPMDIVAGWFVGFLLYAVYRYVFPLIEHEWVVRFSKKGGESG